MKIHKLKTVEPFFSQVNSGEKRFEVRKNDRNFQTGDWVTLIPYPDNGQLPLIFEIGIILRHFEGLADGYVCFQLEEITQEATD